MTNGKGTKIPVEFFASFRLCTWRHEFWFANEISQLCWELRTQRSFQAPLFSAAFTTCSNYTDHSLILIPFHPSFLRLILFFLDLFARLADHPSSSSVAIDLRFFSPEIAENFRAECRTEEEPGMKFVNGLNSNYPSVSFARSLRSAFLRRSLSRPSLCANARCKKCQILERSGSGDRSAVEIRKAGVRTLAKSGAYDPYVIAIKMLSLLWAANYSALTPLDCWYR